LDIERPPTWFSIQKWSLVVEMAGIGFALLAKLGLPSEEAEAHKDDKPSNAITILPRDQSGVGYTAPSVDFLAVTEQAFAKLNACVKAAALAGPKMLVNPPATRGFIPARLRKKPVSSFSNEDLACVFAVEAPTSLPVEAVTAEGPEAPGRRRRRHRHVGSDM
jgi:hypothetical protein